MNFTIHQYLLVSDPAVLFAAGTVRLVAILPAIRNILGDRGLKYIFVSHMESDEAGGIFVFRDAYPDVTIICSSLAAGELPGWGYEGVIEAKSGTDELNDGELSLSFANYPSEMHDQKGIVCFEKIAVSFTVQTCSSAAAANSEYYKSKLGRRGQCDFCKQHCC